MHTCVRIQTCLITFKVIWKLVILKLGKVTRSFIKNVSLKLSTSAIKRMKISMFDFKIQHRDLYIKWIHENSLINCFTVGQLLTAQHIIC